MTLRGILLLICLLVGGAGWLELDRVHHPPPGICAPEEPLQTPPKAPASWFLADGKAGATALASYRIHGRVLHVCHYHYDACAKYAPADLAIGWGRMSDWAVYHRLNISQHGRYYLFGWGPEGPPIPRREIELHSSNNHVIPADDTVRRALLSVRANDVVLIEGSLVEVNSPDGICWRSSLTREDTGGGACEIIRATRLTIAPSDRVWTWP
jgi:hypothetical protein